MTQEELLQKYSYLLQQNANLRKVIKKNKELINQLSKENLSLKTTCLALNEMGDNMVMFCNTYKQVESLSGKVEDNA